MTESNLRKEFEQTVKEAEKEALSSAEFRRKKLIVHAIRTIIALAIYIMFWKYEWVRWTLVFYIPLNVLALFSILGWTHLLRRKIKQTRQKIDETKK